MLSYWIYVFDRATNRTTLSHTISLSGDAGENCCILRTFSPRVSLLAFYFTFVWESVHVRLILFAVLFICQAILHADTQPLPTNPVLTSGTPHNAVPAAKPGRTPDAALEPLDTPNDLAVTLIAAEPTLLSPSTIDVDHQGRIWVAEVVNYRRFANQNRKDREEGDRILILQDTNGDGAVDSSHTYYQGRDIDSAHGICVLGNRVIVSTQDRIINFYDDDGDLIPDRKEVMFIAVEGTQHDHGIHAFTFGPDGRLYFNFGNVGKVLHKPDGTIVTDIAGNKVQDDRQPYQEGMAFRCNLDGSRVETLGWNFRNNWELAVDSFGTIWQSDNDDDGNRATRINFVMEYGNYGYKDEITGAGWRAARTGMEPEIPQQHWHLNDPGVVPNVLLTGAGAPCGIEVYEGSLLPKRFHNQLVHCDAGVNIVRSYAVTSDGAGYSASINPILTSTRDRWFRPSDVSTAADGSLIIADWYDPGVGGHRQGDIDRGRLFRIAPPGTAWRHPSFDFSTVSGAIEGLLSCNRDARYQGWQKLAEAGMSAEQALNAVFQDNTNPRFRARGLWLLAQLKGRAEYYIAQATDDPDENIRIVALRLARQLQIDLTKTIQKLTRDASSAVRRECVIALCNLDPESRPALWVSLARSLPEGDRWFLEALGIAAHGIWDECGTAFAESIEANPASSSLTDEILWRSRSQQSAGLIVERITQLVQSNKTSTDDLARWFRALDFQNQDLVHAPVLSLISDTSLGSLNAELAAFIAAESLSRLHPDRLSGNPETPLFLNRVLRHVPLESRIAYIERFRIVSRYPDLTRIIVQQPNSEQSVLAVRSLLKLAERGRLVKMLKSSSPETSLAVLMAIGNARSAAFNPELQELITDSDADLSLRRAAVRASLKIKTMAEEVIRQTKTQQITVELRQTVAAGLHGSADQELRKMAHELFPLPEAKAGEQLDSISELIGRKGDAKNGRLVFNTTGTCHKCHIVNKIGRNLGPDLSEIGSKLSRQAMLESILFPSAGISHNYDTWTLVLSNGTTTTGLILSETDESLTIIDNEAFKQTVSTDEIDDRIRQSVSMMPADLQKILSSQELIDVVAYMETLKKAAP